MSIALQREILEMQLMTLYKWRRKKSGLKATDAGLQEKVKRRVEMMFKERGPRPWLDPRPPYL